MLNNLPSSLNALSVPEVTLSHDETSHVQHSYLINLERAKTLSQACAKPQAGATLMVLW